MKTFAYLEPTTIEDASRLAAESGAMLKAGGVDLLDEMKEGIVAPDSLVHLRGIKGMDKIAYKNGELRIGALVTLSQVAGSRDVDREAPLLAQAAGLAATPQIRNQATVGGNLCQRPRCWYYRSEDFHCKKKGGDTCFAETGESQYHAIFANEGPCHIVHPSAIGTALVAYNGSLVLQKGDKQRTVKADEFFTLPAKDIDKENILEPGEIVVELRIPASGKMKSAYHKQKERETADWPIAEIAFVCEDDGGKVKGARLVLGAAAPVPWRATEAETYLNGKKIDDAVAREAANRAMKNAYPLEMNGYKIPMFKALIARALLAAAKGGSV